VAHVPRRADRPSAIITGPFRRGPPADPHLSADGADPPQAAHGDGSIVVGHAGIVVAGAEPPDRDVTPMRPRLRLYTGEDTLDRFTPPTVGVRLSELTRILSDAARWNRTWVSDFADDEVQVSNDLYEILSAYTHLRPSA
jgi:hypothetical protein